MDMVRREIESTSRFLSELEDAVSALVETGVSESVDDVSVGLWTKTVNKRDEVREQLDRLNAELMEYGNR